jgi:hypothetical protein
MAASVVPWFMVDRFGRRPILLWGAAAVSFDSTFGRECIAHTRSFSQTGMALIVLGWALKVDASYTANATVVLVIIYNAAFGMSFGPIPWYVSAVSSLRCPATDVD